MSSVVNTANSIPDHNISELYQSLNDTKLCDKYRLKKRLHNTKKISDVVKREKAIAQIAKLITASIENKALKRARLPKITYPEALPVSQNVELISKTIADNQVTIIAGETGSGKTTQIPKICLELGRGIEGIIGHTQPRRIAARTVATRIADELSTKLGDSIGYKVRFTDQVSDTSHVKLMTDGILLAEMQTDRLLRQYDTIIIDEAHERSLNIDFILGYIKQILPKRPDLKVIITSATIDPERFSNHFENAPIIEVSGRTYPVDMVYRPLSDNAEDQDVISGILNAVDELDDYAPGDILIFLNGEREIRDTAIALEKANLRHTQVLPLYSRLTVQEQNRIFMPHSGRNIVLATNVAETSLTVPGIKYVIDPGTARISRYSYRTKVQRLPIEPISQASANQRAGRCGRVSSGVCIRLYSEDDFNNRPEFTDPEILRTNLATVILQMLALDLGAISDFPFVQPPDNRNINDGIKLLEELAAIKPQKNNQIALTKTGRLLSKFPTDPRLSKMILGAIDNGCVKEIFIIVAALSIQDPRERPHEKQQAADEKHNRFKDKQSDFVSFLNLWCYVKQQQKVVSSGQFRKMCQKEFLSYMRLREWQDIYNQLTQTLKDQNIALSTMNYDFDMEAHAIEQAKGNRQSNSGDKANESQKGSKFDTLHQAILSGLLSHLGQLDDNKEYKGARGSKFFIFPGSGIARKPPKWLMAAELVETSRLFARMAARIDPSWIEPLAEHLVKRNYSEPHWEKKQGAVMAFEQVSLYGMTIVAKRKVNFNVIEPHTCREIFIREALVVGDCTINEAFFQENKKLVASIEALEQKARRKDFLVEEELLVAFYDKHLPDEAVCQRSFLSWWKKTKKESPKLLHFTREFLLNETSETLDAKSYPDTWQQGLLTLPLSYHFTPGDVDDGVSVIIPIGILNQVDNIGFDWLIPAMHQELIMALIRGLPKNIRRNFVPAPNYAEACLAAFTDDEAVPITQAISKQLLRMTGVRIPEDIWSTIELPVHLTMNFKVVADNGKLLREGRNLEELREKLQSSVKSTIKKVAEKGIERNDITKWDIGSLPVGYEKKVANITIKAFPALVDHNSNVAIELFEDEQLAQQSMLKGVSRLVLLSIPSPIKYLQEKLPNKAKLGLYFNPFGSINELLQDCIQAACEHLIQSHSQTINNGELPRSEAEFIKVKEYIRAEIADTVLSGAIKLEQILSLTHDIRKTMKKRLDLSVVQAHGDMKEQLDALIFKGFLAASGYKRLDDLQRYLKAIARRLEKLSTDTNQDRLKMLEIEKVDDTYKKLLGEYRTGKVIPDDVAETRWMIEELRVSLFAQNLKTPYPISSKRVLNHIKTL